MSRLPYAFAVAALACLSAAAVQFRSDVRLVVIHATVTGKGGDFVTGLPVSSFHVAENGRLQVLSR